MDIKKLFNHLLCVSSFISTKQCSTSNQLKERETALTRHMTATSRRCTGVMLISHIMNRNIWHQLLWFNKDKKAGSSITDQSARHCGWSQVKMEERTWILLGFVQNIQRNATEIVLIIASSVTA